MLFYFDPLYLLLMLPAIIVSLYAQFKVRHAFSKYSRVRASSGLTGAQVGKKLLERSGVSDVMVERTEGRLTDYYDPRRKVLRLSPEVYEGTSLAALGVAAHEAGHALQDAQGYAPMKLRSGLVPLANFGSNIAIPLIFLGFLIAAFTRSSFGFLLINLGIVAFSLAVIFQIINLPVEFNASNRAMLMLRKNGFITESEYNPTRAVLKAAALTYIAAVITLVLQLLYFILRAQSLERE